MKPSESDCSQLPLCEGPPTDDVVIDEERRDDVAVLTSENGLSGNRTINGKRSQYLVQPRIPKVKCGCRWRQGAVLGLGVFLTVLALTLVVVGAVRSREHTSLKLLHIKQPVDLKSIMYLTDENFTFAQLISLTNMAIDKPSFQSSTAKREPNKSEHELWQAANAVDGDTTSCSSTGLERTPFWYVDLLTDKAVSSIRILGSSFNRLHDLSVYIGKTGNDTGAENRCGALTGESRTTEARIACTKTRRGRYVIIELETRADTYESLVLCEVMVFK
ncbi:hypothetical protein BsWGS_02487 [Bradybaena similaris]